MSEERSYLDKYPKEVNTKEEIHKYFRCKIPDNAINPTPYTILWKNEKNGFCILLTSYKVLPQYRENEAEMEKVKKTLSRIEFNREYLMDVNVNLAQARIYTTFNEQVHIIREEEIRLNPDFPILRGWDFGRRHPAVVFAQKITHDAEYPQGTFLILKEVMGENVSLNEFIDQILHISQMDFEGFKFKDFCDPISITQKSDKADFSAMELLYNRGIIPAYQKFTITTGVNLIDTMLTYRIGGKYPFILVSSSCSQLISGFMGGFRWDKSGSLPLKDGYYEHLHDALRYIVTLNYTFEEVFYLSKREPHHKPVITEDVYTRRIKEYIKKKLEIKNKKIKIVKLGQPK